MNKTNQRNFIRSLSITAAMGALIIVMGLTHIGFIPWFSGASITIMQVPVIIAAILAGQIYVHKMQQEKRRKKR